MNTQHPFCSNLGYEDGMVHKSHAEAEKWSRRNFDSFERTSCLWGGDSGVHRSRADHSRECRRVWSAHHLGLHLT